MNPKQSKAQKRIAKFRKRDSKGRFNGFNKQKFNKQKLPPNSGINPINTFRGFPVLVNNIFRSRILHSLPGERENLERMRFDAVIDHCLRMRYYSAAELPHSLEPEDANDPVQKAVAAELNRIIENTPRFIELKRWLLEAVWFGASMVNLNYKWDFSTGKQRLIVDDWNGVHGDKIVFHAKTKQVGHLVNIQKTNKYIASNIGPVHLLSPEEREATILNQFELEDAPFYKPWLAESVVKGIGLRERLFHTWLLKQEVQGWMIAATERWGLGGNRVWFYDADNPESKTQVQDIAESALNSGTDIIAPQHIGTDGNIDMLQIVPPEGVGLEQMKDIIEGYNDEIMRVICGQTLTQKSEPLGLGSGAADIQADTFSKIIAYDARNLEEVITRDFVRILKQYNFPWADFDVKFKISVAQPDPGKIVDLVATLAQLGAEFDAQEIMGMAGLSMPSKNKPTLSLAGIKDAEKSPEETGEIVNADDPETRDAQEALAASGLRGTVGAFNQANQLVEKVHRREIPRDSAIAMLQHFLGFDLETAVATLGSAGIATPPETTPQDQPKPAGQAGHTDPIAAEEEQPEIANGKIKENFEEVMAAGSNTFIPGAVDNKQKKFGWVTLNPDSDGEPVRAFIDDNGQITAGPSELVGKPISKVDKDVAGTKKDKRKDNKPPKDDLESRIPDSELTEDTKTKLTDGTEGIDISTEDIVEEILGEEWVDEIPKGEIKVAEKWIDRGDFFELVEDATNTIVDDVEEERQEKGLDENEVVKAMQERISQLEQTLSTLVQQKRPRLRFNLDALAKSQYAWARQLAKRYSEFDESKHPRKGDGKFAPKGEGEASGSDTETETDTETDTDEIVTAIRPEIPFDEKPVSELGDKEFRSELEGVLPEDWKISIFADDPLESVATEWSLSDFKNILEEQIEDAALDDISDEAFVSHYRDWVEDNRQDIAAFMVKNETTMAEEIENQFRGELEKQWINDNPQEAGKLLVNQAARYARKVNEEKDPETKEELADIIANDIKSDPKVIDEILEDSLVPYPVDVPEERIAAEITKRIDSDPDNFVQNAIDGGDLDEQFESIRKKQIKDLTNKTAKALRSYYKRLNKQTQKQKDKIAKASGFKDQSEAREMVDDLNNIADDPDYKADPDFVATQKAADIVNLRQVSEQALTGLVNEPDFERTRKLVQSSKDFDDLAQHFDTIKPTGEEDDIAKETEKDLQNSLELRFDSLNEAKDFVFRTLQYLSIADIKWVEEHIV